MENAIQVLTHNGMPPKDGGKRIGYIVGNRMFVKVGTTQLIDLTPTAISPPLEPLKSSLLKLEQKYKSLSMSDYSDGECPHCGHFPNKVERLITDEGEKDLIKCGKCGEYSKPYQKSVLTW